VVDACRRYPTAGASDIPGAPTAQSDGKEVAGSMVRAEKGYVLRKKGKLDPTPARAEKRTASRYYQLAAGEPDDHGVEWFSTKNPDASTTKRVSPLPRCFANIKRGFSEMKRQDAKAWTRKMLTRTGNRKYQAETGSHGCEGQQVPRFPVLPNEDGALPNRPVSRVDRPPQVGFHQSRVWFHLTGRHLLVVSVQDPDSGTPFQELPTMEESAEDSVGNRS